MEDDGETSFYRDAGKQAIVEFRGRYTHLPVADSRPGFLRCDQLTGCHCQTHYRDRGYVASRRSPPIPVR